MIVSVVLFILARPNTGSAGRYDSDDGKLQCFFPRALRICDSTLLSSCTSILPLIMTSSKIRDKQVNCFVWNIAILVRNKQQQPLSVWIHSTSCDLSDGDNYGCPVAPRAAVRPVWNNMLLAGTR